MIIYSCTSTLYYPPVMTVILIVVNVLVYGVTASADPNKVADYCLWYGSGYHPVQWVTSGFMHADFLHLFGNMMFLWPFGLLVEGKLGWWKFLALYLVIAFGQNALEQTIMLGASSTVDVSAVMQTLADDPDIAAMSSDERLFFQAMLEAELGGEVRRSLGASAVIFGLLAVCILWAPVSDFKNWWRFGSFEAPVMLVGAGYFALEVYKWHVGGLGISSAALHLLGLFSGTVVGVAFLRWGIPECDNEDLFNHLFSKSIAKAPGEKRLRPSRPTKTSRLDRAKQSAAAKKKARDKPNPPDQQTNETLGADEVDRLKKKRMLTKVNSIVASIDQGDFIEAAKGLHAQNQPEVLSMISREKYQMLYKLASSAKQWPATALVLQKWLVAHPNDAEHRKLQLARILLMAIKRPEKAKSVLSKIERQKLDDKQLQLYKQLVTKMRQLGDSKNN